MASNRQQTTAYSLFPPHQRQGNVHTGGESNDSVPLPFVSIPSVKQDTASHMPWSHNAQDDPYGLISIAKNSTKSRKPTTHPNCEGETDLQGLVSNILDEADSQDGFYSQGNIPTCNPVWSPNTLKEELLQYFKSETKSQQNPAFDQNFGSREAVSKLHGQPGGDNGEEFCEQSNGFATNGQWLLNSSNGDRENHSLHPQKMLPNPMATYLPQTQQNKYNHMSADRDRRNSQPMNNFLDLSDVCRPQSEMTSAGFHPQYEDHHIQSSPRPVNDEQYLPQDINQLVSSLQLFMAGEHIGSSRGDLSNMNWQTVGMHHEEDRVVEQWKNPNPAMSTLSAPAMQTEKQLLGDLGQLQIKSNGGVKHTFKPAPLLDLPDFSPQKTGFYQQQKPLSPSFTLPNQYQSNMAVPRENTPLPFNMSMNQYPTYHIQQNRIKPQMQREKNTIKMSGLLGEGFSTKPLHNSVRDKKRGLSKQSYLDHQGNMQFQRFDGENVMVSEVDTQQLTPLMYPVNDPRRHISQPISSFNLSSRFSLPFGSGVHGIDVGGMMSPNESAALSSYVSDMKTRNGENPYGRASAMTNSVVVTPGGPAIHFYFYLEKCYEQWKFLEKERLRAEVLLNKTSIGKRTASVNLTNHQKTPPNPTRVDYLIVNQMREQTRVASLLDRMESLQNTPLHINIHKALKRHHVAIGIIQASRKEEIANMSKTQKQRAQFTEDQDALLMANALKDLAAATRKLRTALWCALQMTLPKPIKRLDKPVNGEAAQTDRCPSPFEGYSFRL